MFFPLSIKVSQIIKREGKGGVLGQEKGQPFMGKEAVNGYITIAWNLGLQLSWILCLGLVNTKWMRLGF